LGEVNYGSEAGPAQAAAAFAVPFVLIVPIVLGKQCVVARRFVLVAVRRVCRSIRGAVAQRWFFFAEARAEARHPQNLYYRQAS